MITNNQDIYIDEQVIVDLVCLGELDKDQHQRIIKQVLQSKGKGTEVERLKQFKATLNKMVVQLYASIQEEVDKKEKEVEKLKDAFIDSIPESTFVSQNQLQFVIAKETLRKNADNFIVNKNGVHLKTFLAWLKVAKPGKYELYKSKTKTK